MIDTGNRLIKFSLPDKESVGLIGEIRNVEHFSMTDLIPPIVWDRAKNFSVYDIHGNKWIDLTSGIAIANAGHSNSFIARAIKKAVNHGLWTPFSFPHKERLNLEKKLIKLCPDKNYKVQLLTSGSEAVECAISLAKTYAVYKGGKDKKIIISFLNSFHGNTLTSTMCSTYPIDREMLGNSNNLDIYNIPFPNVEANPDIEFDKFLKNIENQKIDFKKIAAIITEPYQGRGVFFLPKQYAKRLGEFCNKHGIVLIFDEIQSGFGRTGKMMAYQHYEISPDIICCGKGMTSSLPMTAVLGRTEIFDNPLSYPTLTSHAGNPISCSAAIANIDYIENNNLPRKAENLGKTLSNRIQELHKKYVPRVGFTSSLGLVAGIHICDKNGLPDGVSAKEINFRCFQNGVLMYEPKGKNSNCLRLTPPLTITKRALLESLEVLDSTMKEVFQC